MKGIYSALLVSFDKDGNINEKGLREIIRHNIDVCKIDGLYVGGSTGENFMLSTDEKKRIFEIAMDEAKGQVKLIAQVGSVNLKEAVELAKFTTDLGYDAISAVTPFYYKFDFNEIKHYYETIINSVDNKLIIYSIPFLTGVNMSIEQFAELFENDKIIGVKFTAADFYLLERMRKAFPDKLIFAGFLITDILNNGLYQTIKLILQEQGVDAGYCRQPMKEATEEMIAKAKEINKKYF
ncbi:MAG: N-acetylneuraminate lyase [Clostridium perfringens]|nr:N-acetylneuraminate lyase [Clostridium perfringens]